MNLGKVIREERRKKDIKQSEFSLKIGISQTSISQIEGGLTTPSMKNLKKISEVLEIPVPILQWKSIEISDIPENRRQIFKQLRPSVDGLIDAILFDAD